MELDKQIAQKIVKRAMDIIPNSINVMNADGVIIASGDVSRLNQKHVGAVLAIRENRVIEVDAELAQKWHFEAKPGINLPIRYLGKILGAVGISGEPEQVHSYAEFVKMTAELIVEQYSLLEQERWSHRYKENFMLQLLQGSLDPQSAVEQAKIFRIDVHSIYTVALIRLSVPNIEDMQTLVHHLEQADLHVVVDKPDTVALLLPNSLCEPKTLLALLPSKAQSFTYKIAIGAQVACHRYLALSYQTACKTLEYGLKTFPKKMFYQFNDYKLPVLLADLSHSWQAKALLKPIIPLYQYENGAVLRKTLRQYFLSDCDLDLTSRKLFIHHNTLRYRLSKIEQITSLSFNKIDEKFILYLSTLIEQ